MQSHIKDTVQNWHAMSPEEVLRCFEVTKDGVPETQIEKRRLRFGTNAFTPAAPPSLLATLWTQLKSPLALVLIGAIALTIALQEYVDAAVIGIALAISLVVSLLQEGKASRAFAALSASQSTFATVVREGKRHEIPAAQVVVGDVVIVHAGMQVAADMRVLEGASLETNEAALTGEWLPVKKQITALQSGIPLSERSTMLYKGTFVSKGTGLGVVVAVGDRTEVGKIAAELSTIEEAETPIQKEMKRVSAVLLYIVGALVIGIFVLGIVYGQSLHEMILMTIAIAVASIPEGLPAAVTIILAIGMESLLRRGGLVKNLLAAETLGSTTYILTDKTGTLTEARMKLTSLIFDGTVHSPDDTAVFPLIETAVAATDAFADETDEGVVLRGDPVEKAILELARIHSLDHGLAARMDYIPFTSEQRFAAGLVTEDNGYKVAINGAPELLLHAATRLHTKDGVIALTKEVRKKILAAIAAETAKGSRLVAVAYRSYAKTRFSAAPDLLSKDLVFQGVLVMSDPVRPDVAGVVASVQAAGVEIRLVTGDNAETARAIAREVGIVKENERVIEGSEMKEMSDEELLHALRTTFVFARVLPTEKKRLADVLQRAGEVVAMTGDGVNDGPALEKADIGVAVGSGTMVAKESADLILIDDSFATIYAAIEEGRRVIANIRKVIGYLLSTSLGEVMIIGAALAVGAPAPLVPVQILWANVIEEGLMGVAFAFEKGEKGAMQRRPQDIHKEGIFSRTMISFLLVVVAIVSALSLALYFYLRSLGASEEVVRSVMFLLVSVDSLFMAFAFRSLTVPVWRIPLTENKFFIGSFVVTAGLLFLVLSVPFMQSVLSYQPLASFFIWLVIGVSVASLLAVEVAKAIFFEKRA